MMDAYDHLAQFAEPSRTPIVERKEWQVSRNFWLGVRWGMIFGLPFWILVGVGVLAWFKTH